jgi:aminomethyltransferase
LPPVSLKRSPLDDSHRALGAKMVEFGGWDMPVSYPSGTLQEHVACRNDAVVFDVSHLGTVRVSGPEAFASLQVAFTNDLGKVAPGRAQYTHLLDEHTGGVLDDIIVWWLDEQTFDVMPNASNTGRVVEAIGGTDTTGTRAILAVQGPNARAKLAMFAPEAAAVRRFGVTTFSYHGVTCTVAGTGYTGEDGVELSVPNEVAASVWHDLLAAGVSPAGLGARDTLRLEAALPLHGHELGPDITPLQAGLGWVVAWSKPLFRGKAALERERATGPQRLLRGLATEGRRPPRAESAVFSGTSEVGVVSSGNFSVVLEHGIALAFLNPAIEIGDSIEVDVRGARLPGRVVPIPFVAKHRS